MKKMFVFITLILVVGMAEASSETFRSEIKRVYPLATGDFIIVFKANNPECSRGDDYHHIKEGESGVTREGVKSMLSTVLTAASTGREVTIIFDSDSDKCAVNRLYVSF